VSHAAEPTPPPSTVADVVARMEAIVAPLPRSDGIACFTLLYLAVTEQVQAQLAGLTFGDPRFLARLDVVFADLYFTAFDAFRRDPAQTPRAWLPLFEARSRRHIAPLQFALAGMNAHINRDLPVALVATCRELGLGPEQGSVQHADFERVNGLLATVEAQVKQQYLSGWLRRLDRLLHHVDRIDDVVAMWNIERAREAAWVNAEALWAIRDDADLSEDFLSSLDRMAGFAGRGLLVPADTWVGRIGRALGGSPSGRS
jgi:hypothetical protein